MTDLPASAPEIVIVFTAAFSLEIDGSHARVASMLNRISSEFDDVTVYSHSNHHQYAWTTEAKAMFARRWPRVRLVTEPYTRRLRLAAALKNLAISCFPNKAARILRLVIPNETPLLRQLEKRNALFIVNYKHAMSQLNGIDPARCWIETHDLLCLKWAKLTHSSPVSVNVLRKLRGEIAVLDAANGVVAISPAETAFFRLMLTAAETFYVSSWEKRSAKVQIQFPEQADFDLVFVASSYVMNVRGFIDMLSKHGSWLARYRIAVCGQICDEDDLRRAVARFSKITLLGFVPDIDDIYRRSKAALAPVDGTGLKIKLVSALEAGIPVLASVGALAGLPPGSEGAVFVLNEQNARTILDDDSRLSEARAAATRYFSIFTSSGDAEAVLAALRPSSATVMISHASPRRAATVDSKPAFSVPD